MSPSNKKVVYLGLSAFSQSGGIENVNKGWLKSLSLIKEENHLFNFRSLILLDDKADHKYIKEENFKGFQGHKIKFALYTIWYSLGASIIIASHIHLSPLLYIIKLMNPSVKIYLHAHGIEVWRPLNRIQKKVLKITNQILAVSAYTKNQLIKINNIEAHKIKVLPNALDPFFYIPDRLEKPNYLLNRYGIESHQKILFTLARLASTEQYKGYDKVIETIPYLKEQFPDIMYLIGGKADDVELKRIKYKVEGLKISQHVKLLGYIKNEELTDHYLLGDAFVMPSEGEGFGIAFIEASVCGRPVLAGNLDGSSQAVKDKKTGLLCNPRDHHNITEQIKKLLNLSLKAKEIQNLTINHFNFKAYKTAIKKLMLIP